MLLKMSSRSSRSRPASLISLSEPTGSASRAIAIRPVPLGLGPRGTVPDALYAARVGRAADRLREERRRTLGDWVAFCPVCGHGERYFEGTEGELSAACPQ